MSTPGSWVRTTREQVVYGVFESPGSPQSCDRDAVIVSVTADHQRPVLVFDGHCSFCRIWVGYWQSLTGDRVEYVPYQTDAGRFPDVPVSEFQKAVQLFDGGSRYSGAEAVSHLVASRPGGAWALWMYQNVPGAGPVSEALYRFIAAQRDAAGTPV